MNLSRTLSLFFILLSVTTAFSAKAEGEKWKPNTLVSGSYDTGGYGSVMVKYRTIKDQESVWTGGRGGWIIDHRMVIGGGGYGLCNQPKVEKLGIEDIRVTGGYGGLFFEYIFLPKNPVHFSTGVMVGAGGFNFFTGGSDWDDDWDNDDYDSVKSGVAFVANPWVSLDLNVLPFMRIGLEADYMIYEGVNYGKVSDRDMGGPSVGMTFKFGRF